MFAKAPAKKILSGDGRWAFVLEIDGEDLVARNVRATCFGGSSDPQDNGETASGISTRDNPDLAACSLPMDGRKFPKMSAAEHAALDGSPVPRLPFGTVVEVTQHATGKTIRLKVIELGPGRRTGNAIDLTIAAARQFFPKATATNFATVVDFRILGGARYAA